MEEFEREAALLYQVLQTCRADGSRLVYFSTSSAGMYGGQVQVGREDGPVYPNSAYGRHKLAMEAAIAASGSDFLVLRLAYAVGPTQRPHQLLPSLISQIRTGTVRIYRGGRRDLIDIANVVTIVNDLLKLELSREVVNVATGIAVPAERIVEHIESMLGVVAKKQFVDVSDGYAVSTDKLRRLVPAVEKMGFTADYYRRVIDKYIDIVAAG